jgi:hypothetical protein
MCLLLEKLTRAAYFDSVVSAPLGGADCLVAAPPIVAAAASRN